MRRSRRIAIGLGVAFLLGLLALYAFVASGGMTARRAPSTIEGFIGGGLVDLGIDRASRERVDPLSRDPGSADVAAGRDLYAQDCQSCHGSDGRGRTSAGATMYPPAVALDRLALATRHRTDGELFFLIRNGIRNTGMPAWDLPDQQIWQLVSYVRQLPPTAATSEPIRPAVAGSYVGSAACKPCHAAIHERWSRTPMANVVRDPREHPDAILPDLTKPDPLLTFGASDVALVYGSRWKQRYFKKVGDDYFPLSAQWDITHSKWKPYFAKDDWWASQYPPDNAQRPTGPLCDGCHSVNYDIATRKVTEWNVGCERCHGPGSIHAQTRSPSSIVNPTRLGIVAANDVCIACHSQGRPLQNPIAGKTYDWAVGYDVTRKLADFWALEPHRVGETTFTHFADGTAHKNRMQGNDFVTSAMYTHGVTCSTCHDAHGTDQPAGLRKPASVLCLDCHGPRSPNGPRAPTLAEHTHHANGSEGSECIGCHMPKIAQTLGDVNVRSHTFRFVTPAMTEGASIPNACNACHADRSPAWATAALRSWADRSPWR